MENKSSKNLRREKVTRYSIRKYSFGAASVAVAALFMFLGNGAVSANELSKTEGQGHEKSLETNESQVANESSKPAYLAPAAPVAPVVENTVKPTEGAPVEKAAAEEPTAKPAEVTTPALDKTQLKNYISEIESKISAGKYATKTEESVALLTSELASAKSVLESATSQEELNLAYRKLVTTVSSKLKNKPKKEAPKVDTTNGQPTLGKKAENTEPKAGTNSIENSGSHDSRNGKVMDKENAFRTEATAATHQPTTTTVGNISYTLEYSNDADKEIYLYNEEEANINITINSTDGAISKAFIKAAGNVYLDPDKKARKLPPGNETQEEVDGFGWTYHQILSDTPSPATVRITGKPNATFMGLKPTTRKEDQNSVLGARYLQVQDAAGGAIAAGGNKNAPGYFNLVVKSQTYKYDIKDLTDSTRITVNDINNVTDAELTTIKSRLQLEHSKTSNDARFVGGADVANPTSVIDTVAVSTTEPSKLVVTYKDGSTDTIEKNKVLNVRPKGIIPFSNPTAKEIYVYKGEETNLEFGVTDDSGKIKDLRIVQGSANINNSGAARGQVRDEYGLTMTSETNENGIVATTDHPAITRITGTVSVSGKPNFVGPLMTRYLVAEDLEGAVFSYPDANKNMDQEGAFKLVVREQTQKYDVQLQGAESNKIAVADVNNLSTEDFEKIKSNIKIVYNTADDARLRDKEETKPGKLVENASQYIQSITNSGNNIVVTYKDGSTDTIEKTSVLRSAPGPVVTRTQSRKSVLREDGVLSTDRTLSGTGTPGATIKVSVKDEQNPNQLRTLYDNVTVGTDGNWSVDLTHGLYSNITDQTQLYPREPLSVTQTVNGLESVETVVPVALGASKVLPSEASKDGASVVAGSNKLVVKVPHDAGIAYVDYKNKETDARSELAFKRENKDSQWTMKDASKATITSVTSDSFYDTVTLEMKEKIKEGTDVRVISNIFDGKYSSPVGWVSTPVSNEKPTLTSTNGQTETTVNVGDTVDPMSLVTAADHEDDKNATLGTKGTTEVVSVNGDETVKTIDTTTAGTYVVKYKVVDSQGKESDVLTHTVIVNLDKQPAINAVEQAATAQIEKINGNKEATQEEKEAAITKVNNDKQAALNAINADTVKTKEALTQAQNTGTTAIGNDNPETSVKANAKNAIDQDLADKISAIEGRQDLSAAEKKAGKDKATEKATAAKTAIENATTTAEVNTAKGNGTTAINNVTPIAKEAAKKAINDELATKNTEIDNRQDLSQAEKTAAKAEAKNLADAQLAEIAKQPDATDTPDATTTAQQAVDAAKTKGVADVRAVNPLAKDAAKADIETARQNKVNDITNNNNLSQAEKDAAIAKVNKAAEDATKAVDAATTADALTTAKGDGTTAINNVTPVAKEAAKQAIADALNGKDGQKGKLQEIEERTDLTDEEKAAAKKDAQDKANAELAKINAQPDAADTPDAATTAQKAVDAAGTKGAADVKSVNPTAVKKPEAKQAVEAARKAKEDAIKADANLTQAEKDAAIEKNNKAAEDATKAIDAATTDTAVEQAKTAGTGEIAKVNPVAKEKAKEAIATALTAKNNEIDARKDLTDDEKAAAKAEAKKLADAETAKVDGQPDNVETADAATAAQKLVNDAKDKGVGDVTAVRPIAKEKAKQAIADELTKKEAAIDGRTDLTTEEKAAAKKDAQAKAKKATDAITAQPAVVDTEEKATAAQGAVDTAKTTGVSEVQAVNPTAVKKPEAKKAVADALKAKEAAIDARTDLTDAEKKVAKDAAKAKADAATKAIDAATTDAAVDTAKTAGTDDIATVNPVAKEAAKKAVADTLKEKEAAIDARTDLTDEEKTAAKKDAKDKADAQLAEIAKQPDNAATPEAATAAQTAVDTAKKTGEDEVTAVNPEAVTKPTAKKAIEDKLAEQLETIANTPDATDEEKAEAAKKATDAAEAAKAEVDKETTDAAVKAEKDKAVGEGDTKGTIDQAVPVVEDKPNARKAIDEETAAKKKEIDARTDLTPAAKEVLKAKVDKVAKKAKEGIDAVSSVEDVNTIEEADKTAIRSIGEVNRPIDKVLVKDPSTLTDEEKAKILEEVKKVNPTAKEVKYDDNGKIEVTTEAGDKGIINPTKLAKTEDQLDNGKGGNDINKPLDKVIVKDPSKLTDEEKAKIVAEVEEVNPDAIVTIDENGTVTVSTPNGKTAAIPATDLVRTKEDTAKAGAGNSNIVKPADKVVGEANDPDDQAKVEAKLRELNPETKSVKLDENGNATVTLNDGTTATIPSEDLFRSEADLTKPNAGNDIVKPADKTVVSNPDALTPEEKKAIEDKVKAVNPEGTTVVVDDKGNATVTTPEGKTAVIPAADLTKSAEEAAKPNAGNDIVKPADKTVVANPDSLTQDEKDAIVAKVKAVNPGAEVVVDDKGNATVTVNGKTAVIPAADLTKSAEEAAKPNAGNDIVKPADKTVVANPDSLTQDEKDAIVAKVKAVNPGAEVVVDDKGNATVTVNGKTAVIPAADLTKSAEEAAKPNAGNDIVKPADKTVVANPDSLTQDEKDAIVAKVKAVNPGAEVVVDDKGNATVTVNGKTAVIPAADLTKSAEEAAKPNAGNDIVKPADKTVVSNPDALTPEEKKAIEEKVKAVNPGATVAVDDKGNATVTKDGKTAVIPATDLTKSAEEAAKPNAGNDIVKPADKTVVANPDSLTQDEKDTIVAKVKAVNPGVTVVVDDKGNATVTTPEGKTAVIPASDLTKSAEEAAKPNAGNDIVKPADKTVVANPDSLTQDEKDAIVAKVKAVNPGAEVVVDDKGNATVTTPDGKTAVIPASDLTKSAEEAAKPNAGNDIVKPADKTVVANPDSLTQDEKDTIVAKVKAVNPGVTVVVDDKGNATVTTPEGKTAVIPASDLTKSAEEAAKPNAGNDIVKPADKTVVANPDSLTQDEKDAIVAKVKAVNPGAEVVVDDKGNATVTTPDGKTAVIPASDLTKSAEEAAKPNAGNDIVKPADKTVVANPEQLTDKEKEAVKKAVEAVNPGATVVVDEKGNATVTKDGKTAVIPASDLTKSAEEAAKPNAGNDIVKPADKTVVANPDSLTQDEKDAIVAKVKAVNPGAEVVVDDKGNATVTVNGKTAVIPASDLTKSAADAAKPNAGNDIVKPADKTVVANPDSLTQDEKDAIVAKVKAVNPGAEVVVDDKGNATVTVNGKTAVIPASDLTKSAEEAAKPNAGNDIVKPADKTVVANPNALTPEEKDAIVAKVKAVNPGAEVVVDDKGNATVTVNGKTAVIPASDLTKSAEEAAKPNAGNDIVKPADKTVVANPNALTPEEKDAIVAKVKAVNPGAEVVVDDKGNATVTVNGKTAVIPASDLTKSAEEAAKPNAGNDIVKPADKTVVANPNALTPEEKDAIVAKVKAVNPGAEVVVDDKGNATVTVNGKTAVIPASDLTKSKEDATKPKAGNDIVKPASKTKVANPDSLTQDEKDAIAAKVKAVNPGTTVVVDDKGNATVTTPEGKTAVIPASDLTKSEKDVNDGKAKDNAVTPASKTKVADPNSLTPEEKKVIADKVKAVNPGAEVVVDDKGNATVVKEGNVSVIPSTDLVKVEGDATKPNGGNDANTPAAKTVVENPDSLDSKEKAAVKKAVEAVNPGSTVVVDDKGNATVTKGDGTVLNIPASDLVIPAEKFADEAKTAKVKTPAIRTLVGNKENLTKDEKDAVKKSIEAVNPGATVVVDDKGNATVTMPDGSTATISKDQLVKDKEAVSKSKHGGDNLDIDLSKVEVKDLENITPEEKAKFQFKVLGAITNVEEFDLDAYIKSTDKDGNTVYTSKDGKVKITIDKDGNATVDKDGKKELAINIDKAGNVTIVTKEGQVLAIPRDDAFKQYVPYNAGGNNNGTGNGNSNGTSGNNAANNTDAKVDKAKLEGAIHQLDELIIKESAKLDAETAKEANDLLADAKKVFANADASQAEVDAMVKRIEDFMAKVASSTDHATPANDQAAQTSSVAPATTQAAANASQEAATNARKAAKELPNTGTADSTVAMVAAAASALLGLGLAGRRRKEDEEA